MEDSSHRHYKSVERTEKQCDIELPVVGTNKFSTLTITRTLRAQLIKLRRVCDPQVTVCAKRNVDLSTLAPKFSGVFRTAIAPNCSFLYKWFRWRRRQAMKETGIMIYLH
jgi:hypothetical protein